MDKKAQLEISWGFLVRLFGGLIEVFSIPFIITNPTSIIAWIFFTIGGGLITVGGVMN